MCHTKTNEMIGYVVSEAEAVYHETNAGYTTQMKFHFYLSLLPALFFLYEANRFPTVWPE